MAFCSYFQAKITKRDTWFFVATLRFNEHLAFDRTFDKAEGIFEFFVPTDNEEAFLLFMKQHEKTGLVSNIIQLPNRLLDPTETV
ncbi:TPA: hypothetical protein DDZ86_02530 [Candidatus Dependentiae bacterium]|nr:hypothetical protein [Candidatus Dependentiae bacterium]